jgi:hypothetical protein
MNTEGNEQDVPVSNWTLATGTNPGERHVYPAMSHNTARPASNLDPVDLKRRQL